MRDKKRFWSRTSASELNYKSIVKNRNFFFIQETPSADEAEFGEWPHVCALLKKEDIGNVNIYWKHKHLFET